MERYIIIEEVGAGTFGNVWRAKNMQSGEIVAIKKLKRKYYSWEECLNLREVKSLLKMNHPNIVKLKEVISENDVLFFVFEYMECNLYQLMKDRGELFTEVEIRNWCFQVFQALAYMHQQGYFHQNLLVGNGIIKIADFGLAREVSSEPPYTEYVTTRWYRAPEVLLHSSVYDTAVDTWAMGAIMAELFTLQPLFPGSSGADQIYKICSVIGTPNQSSWAEGLHLADVLKYQFPQFSSVHLSELIPTASQDAINLISKTPLKLLIHASAVTCSWDPSKRPKAVEALQHSFFQSCYCIPPSLRRRAEGRSGKEYYQDDSDMNERSLYQQPPARNNNAGYLSGDLSWAADVAEKLEQLTLCSSTDSEPPVGMRSVAHLPPVPPWMHGRSAAAVIPDKPSYLTKLMG